VIVDGDKVPPVLEVSPRVAGDRIQPLGMKGTKKLKDFLIDRKVPREMRDNIPVIRAGEDIIWLPSLTISEKIKVTSETKNYLILEVKKQ
jgi:tRNA(Ile)-lysidine synthase